MLCCSVELSSAVLHCVVFSFVPLHCAPLQYAIFRNIRLLIFVVVLDYVKQCLLCVILRCVMFFVVCST